MKNKKFLFSIRFILLAAIVCALQFNAFSQQLNFSVAGKVTDEDTGESLTGVILRLYKSNGELIETVTDQTGTYKFDSQTWNDDLTYTITCIWTGYPVQYNKFSKKDLKGSSVIVFDYKFDIEHGGTINTSINPINATFDFNSDLLNDVLKRSLDTLSLSLFKTSILAFNITGFVDYSEISPGNHTLPGGRAEAVCDYLVGKGVAMEQLCCHATYNAKPYMIEYDGIYNFEKFTFLDQAFIDNLKSKSEKELAHRLNRRVELKYFFLDNYQISKSK